MEELVRFDGGETEYFSFGSGERTFVILPGLGTRSILFSRMMISAAYKRFCDDFTLYVFDRRRNLPPTYTVREMARDTAAAMRALGLRNADIFGASLGGMTAQFIAIDSPELVRSLVLGSTALKKWFPGAYAAPGQWISDDAARNILVTYSPLDILRFPVVTPAVKKIKQDMWNCLKAVMQRVAL